MELIKIYKGNVVSARELHTFLQVKSRFADWIRNRINKYDFKEGEAFSKILEKGTGGRGSHDYILTITMAKELCMVENNDLGKRARRYFIDCEKALQELKTNKRLEYWNKLESTKDKFSKNVVAVGGTEEDYVQIDFKGRQVLFNGEPMSDQELPLILLKVRDLAVEMTNEGFKSGMSELDDITSLHKRNHEDLRNLLEQNTGKAPEELDSEEDIKKLKE